MSSLQKQHIYWIRVFHVMYKQYKGQMVPVRDCHGNVPDALLGPCIT